VTAGLKRLDASRAGGGATSVRRRVDCPIGAATDGARNQYTARSVPLLDGRAKCVTQASPPETCEVRLPPLRMMAHMTTRDPFASFRALALLALLAAACQSSPRSDGSPGSPAAPPTIESFTPSRSAVFVGEATELTAVFSGDSASIAGIGPVESGVAVATPALARATTFTLTVRRAQQQVEASVSIAASYRDRFRELAPSPVARRQHVAVALADGGALVMGGNTSEFINTPDTVSTHRFDPITETVSPGPELAFSAQAFFTAPARLDGGGFLLVGGGINSEGIAAQAFDATARRFERVGDTNLDHAEGATATALGDGSVLVAGGQLPALSTAERYDPTSRQWSLVGDMAVGRLGHTATRLADGRVLIVGGQVTCCAANGELFTRTAEIYDSLAGGFQATGSLATARVFHAATLLPDGRVLVTGGFVDASGATTPSAEIYDPSTGRFSAGGDMQVARDLHSAILLTDGRVLVLGGERASAETDVFDPATDRWSAGPTLQPAWAAFTATLLANGKVLVFGGEDAAGFPASTVMLFE
jgi:Kelch motif protein